MDRAKKFMEFIKGRPKDWNGTADSGQLVTVRTSKLGLSAYILDPDTKMTDSATTGVKTMNDVWVWLNDHGVKQVTWDDGTVSRKDMPESSYKTSDKTRGFNDKERKTIQKRLKHSKDIGKGIMQDYAYRKAHKVTEGLKINLEYFTLIPGEHPLGLVLDELEALVEDLRSWREMGTWRVVSATDSKHQEIIPSAFSKDLSKKTDRIKVGG